MKRQRSPFSFAHVIMDTNIQVFKYHEGPVEPVEPVIASDDVRFIRVQTSELFQNHDLRGNYMF